jgi:hypothetical protein
MLLRIHHVGYLQFVIRKHKNTPRKESNSMKKSSWEAGNRSSRSQNSPAFYVTQWFIRMFTKYRQSIQHSVLESIHTLTSFHLRIGIRMSLFPSITHLTSSYMSHLLLCILYVTCTPPPSFHHSHSKCQSRDSDWLRAGQPRCWSSSPGRVNNFYFSVSFKLALGPIRPPIQWVPGYPSSGVKRPGREADH